MKAVLKVLGFLFGVVCLIYGIVGTAIGLSEEPGMQILLIFTVPIAALGLFLILLTMGKLGAKKKPSGDGAI
jgi:amino acid transporter